MLPHEADYDYDCTLYRWSMEESVKEISEGFARSTGKNVGNIKDIELFIKHIYLAIRFAIYKR